MTRSVRAERCVSRTDMDREAAGAWAVYQTDKNNAQARKLLLEIYLPMAVDGAQREAAAGGNIFHHGQHLDEEDLRQMAVLCLVDLLNSYDSHVSTSFTKYASPLMRLRIKEALRNYSWVPRKDLQKGIRDGRVSGYSLVTDDDYRTKTVFDVTPCQDEGPTLPIEREEFIEHVLAKLPHPREKRIFSLKFLDRLSNDQIGTYIGRTGSMVSMILNQRIVPAIAEAFPDAPGGVNGVTRRLKHELKTNRTETK